MEALKLALRTLGLDSWVFGITGFAAILFSVVSFLGIFPLSLEQMLQIVVGALGVLMLAVIAQTTRRKVELLELKDAFGGVDIQLFGPEKFARQIVTYVIESESFVLDTGLNQGPPQHTLPPYFSGLQAEYRRLLFKRVNKDEITLRRIETISHNQYLERSIFRLLLFEGHRYFARYYEPLSSAFPVIDLMSFDDKLFCLGGFYDMESSKDPKAVCIRESNIGHLLKDYWNLLWQKATPLNDGGVIDWEKLKNIGSRLGMTENDFEAMISRVKEQVQFEKSQLGRL